MSSVDVEINGRETVSKAALEAGSSIKKMGDDSKGIFDSIKVTAGDVVNAISGVASTVGEFFTEYADQQRSIKTYDAAMKQSDQITTEGAERLKQYAGTMALRTGADDEAILSMEAFLATSGRTEDQIRKVIAAAADMSTVTGKDLKTSVEEINKTFSGTAGGLGKVLPGMKDLTEEQLKAGAGVDLVAKQYGGLAVDLAGSAAVGLNNFTNAVDDLKASMGEAVMPAVMPILEGLIKFLNETAIPTIQSVAPIVKSAVEFIEQLITEMKPIIEPVLNWLGEVFKLVIGPNISEIGDILKAVISLIVNVLTGDWAGAWGNLKEIVTSAINIIKNAFTPMAEAAKAVWDKVKSPWDRIWVDLKNAVKKPIDDIKAFFDSLVTAVEKVINGISSAMQFVTGEKRVGNWLVDRNGKIIGEYITKDGKETLKRYASGTNGAAPGLALVGEKGPELVVFKGGEQVIPNSGIINILEAIGIPGLADGTGGNVSGATGGAASPVTGLSSIMDNFGTALLEAVKSIESVSAIINWMGTISKSIVDVIGPVVNTVLQPIVGILRILGQTIGQMLVPLLTAIAPILQAVGKAFVWFYNTLLPIFNFVIGIYNTLGNAIAWLINSIKHISIFGWQPFNDGSPDLPTNRSWNTGALQPITYEDLNTAGTATGGTTGTAASYTKPRDITVNIEVNTSALVGEDGISEFALIIGRELKAAGVLNVA